MRDGGFVATSRSPNFLPKGCFLDMMPKGGLKPMDSEIKKWSWEQRG